MEKAFYIVASVFLAVLLAFLLFDFFQAKQECNEKNGVLVRGVGVNRFVCIEPSAVKG